MSRSTPLCAGLIWLAVSIGSSAAIAQPADYAAPVPGPYQAMPTPPVQANPYSNPGFAQSMPYWMRPQQQQANRARPTAKAGRQTYIPGWVWSPYAPNAGRPASGWGARAPAGQAPGNTPRYIPGYAPQAGQGNWPGYPAPGFANGPWGPGWAPGGRSGMTQYGAPRAPQQ